jgi:glutamine synthetase
MASALSPDVVFPSGTVIAEYVWLDGRLGLRSKPRTLEKKWKSFDELKKNPSRFLPRWNYDGSSTEQAPGTDSEVIVYPQAVYKCPFRGGDNILVMCDMYTPGGEPIPTNHRYQCQKVMEKAKDLVPWFGIEQEYFIVRPKDRKPAGFPEDGSSPAPQFAYYCGVGASNAHGRRICDEHYKACLYAGIQISGTNGEVAPGQWEFQVGPCVGIDSGDQLWMARYILSRIAECYGYDIELSPKPVVGDWNGSGAHTNFSTLPMRKPGGIEEIYKAIERLSLKHKEHIAMYGQGNEKRLTGKHETASIESFSWGKASRAASVRVGNATIEDGCGYFEDRRPAANMDPYLVTMMLVSTCCEVPIEKMPTP